jgi:hypothetical protein
MVSMFDRSVRMNQRITKWAAVLAIFCLVLMVAPAAKADPITGEVAFVGAFQATGGSSATDLANATGIQFTGAMVGGATGAFAANGVNMFTPVSLSSFTFAPFSGPVDPLWAVGVFQFALDTVNVVNQTAGSLVLSGSGVVSTTVALGLDATAFTWSFSGDNSGGQLQMFSSTSTPTPVTEPSDAATLLLLAMSTMVFGMRSSKFRKALQY